MVAGLHVVDVEADLLDDTSGFVAEHRRQRMRIEPFHEMQVGMTEPGDTGADQDLARSGFLQADVLDHKRLVDFMQGGGPDRCFLFFLCSDLKSWVSAHPLPLGWILPEMSI